MPAAVPRRLLPRPKRSFADCEFALPRVALAIAGNGRDVITARSLSRAWHAALRQIFADGLLEELRLHLNVDSLVADLTARCRGDGDDESDEEEDYLDVPPLGQPRPPGERALVRAGSGEVTTRLFSPCGERVTLVTAGRMIRTLDVKTGSQLHSLAGHTGVVQALSYSPCTRFLLSASLDSTARIWDAASGTEVKCFTSASGPLYDAVFSRCGQRILTGSFGGEAVIWDVQTGDELQRMQGHGSVVFSCDYSRDDRFALTISKDGGAKLWDALTGDELCGLGIQGTKLRGASFTPCEPQSILAVTEDGVMIIWSVPDGTELRRWSGRHIAGAAFSPYADRLVVTTRDYSVWLLDASVDGKGAWDEEQQLCESETYEPQLAGFSPCGRFVLTAGGGVMGRVRLWDSVTLEELCAYDATPGVVSGVNKVGFSPCGSRLLVATYNGAVLLWGRGPAF